MANRISKNRQQSKLKLGGLDDPQSAKPTQQDNSDIDAVFRGIQQTRTKVHKGLSGMPLNPDGTDPGNSFDRFMRQNPHLGGAAQRQAQYDQQARGNMASAVAERKALQEIQSNTPSSKSVVGADGYRSIFDQQGNVVGTTAPVGEKGSRVFDDALGEMVPMDAWSQRKNYVQGTKGMNATAMQQAARKSMTSKPSGMDQIFGGGAKQPSPPGFAGANPYAGTRSQNIANVKAAGMFDKVRDEFNKQNDRPGGSWMSEEGSIYTTDSKGEIDYDALKKHGFSWEKRDDGYDSMNEASAPRDWRQIQNPAPGGDMLHRDPPRDFARLPDVQGEGMQMMQPVQKKVSGYGPRQPVQQTGWDALFPGQKANSEPQLPALSPEQLSAFKALDARGFPARVAQETPQAPSRFRMGLTNYFPGNDYDYLQQLFPGKSIDQILQLFSAYANQFR